VDIRKATFAELFGTAFAVGAAFDAALFIVGLLMAILSPGMFHSGAPGAQVAASSPVQAIGVLVLLTVFALLANLVVSSAGAGLLVAGRSIGLFGSKAKA
jgi:hypothetical protein